MSKQKIKRHFFFWIDRLQITRRERFAITTLFCLLLTILLLDVFIKPKVVPPADNYEEILAEFERKSALIEREQLEIEAKYNPSEFEAEVPEMVEVEPVVVSINSGTKEELMTLTGIGEAYAQRIIEYRETNGDFTSVEELTNVKGIGERTLEKLKPYIKL